MELSREEERLILERREREEEERRISTQKQGEQEARLTQLAADVAALLKGSDAQEFRQVLKLAAKSRQDVRRLVEEEQEASTADYERQLRYERERHRDESRLEDERYQMEKYGRVLKQWD